ncbi:AraC family transcriptional regulator [Arthrobacter sp. I2-34]|uniref:AraC family transcriptional regulator n=1 Tax=Arthrobacter hankyongi TaxID=2904801 RepID=A0ABS9L2A3_9MICC|nr:AraC family transcriptional regulator [Arthrobacter hankyongi]MCG2620805.1 AraC family transcriptional regulator [Arthrobacter hankyongi]
MTQHLSHEARPADPRPERSIEPPHRQAKTLKFTTRGIPAVNRMQLWAHHNAKALISLDIRTMDEQPLQAAEINLHFPSLKFAEVKGSAQVVERNERYIRQNPMDVIAVFFALEGEAFFYHQGGHESLKPGQAVIYDADRPFMRGFSRGLREMVLTIPRGEYLELAGGRPLTRPLVFDFNEAAPANRQMMALARLVRSTLEQPGDPERTEGSVMELLSLLVAGDRGGAGAGYLAAARCYIEDRLSDPALTAGEVAAAVGVSERHLARIFTEAGEAPSAFVLSRRLETARGILTDPHQRTTPVGRVAAMCGFASQSYFARAFKVRFGMTPLQLRRDALLGVIL